MRRLELNTSELLEMRKQGMTNKEIAKSLDCSVNTIINRIGSMTKREKRLDGVKKLPPAEKEAVVLKITESIAVNGFAFNISHMAETVEILPPNQVTGITISVLELDELVSALKAVTKICRTES